MNPDIIQIDNRLSGQLKLGVIQYTDLIMPDLNRFNRYMDQQLADLKSTILDNSPPGYTYMRRVYRDFHIDPTRHRPSSEALLRRFKNSGDFPRVLPPVDLTNLLSLRFQICYGLYDVDQIKGDLISACLGDESDHYLGIRKEELSFAGKIVLRDVVGAMGNPSADSLRTAVTGETSQILQILFFHPDFPGIKKVMEETTREFRLLFQSNVIISEFC